MEFERQYKELKQHFQEKGFETALAGLENIKTDSVKLLKLYNLYFRNPYKRKDLYMEQEIKIRKAVRHYLNEVIKEEEFGDDLGGLENIRYRS